jgi:hypothetical protein
LERTGDADVGDEVEAGDQRAGDRAGSVDRVEHTDLAADAIVPGDGGLHHQGQRRTHQRRRHDQYEEGDDEADHGDGGERVRQRAMKRDPDAGERVQQWRREEGGDADENFSDPKRGQRTGDTGGETPGKEAAEAEPRHERCEYRARRIDSHAEHERQQPQPHHLVHQRTCAGTEEQDDE